MRKPHSRKAVLAALLLLGALHVALGAGSARAVLIASGSGTGNTTAPSDDPGFANVGVPESLSAVYLGNNWVLTANHVVSYIPTSGGVTLAGATYPWIPASLVQFRLGGGVCPSPPLTCQAPSDLALFKIQGDVPLPALALRPTAPTSGADLVLVGRGQDRGAETTWNGSTGYLWLTSRTMRWGTNKVKTTGFDLPLSSSGCVGCVSRAFSADFKQSGGTPHESIVANGDSGGAAFIKRSGVWELAGILFARSTLPGQPYESSLFGTDTYVVDLSHYRADILAYTSQPACNDGWDDDGDGFVDLYDPGCASAGDLSERTPLLECDDGVSNDGDGLVDQDDPACPAPGGSDESPACQDGLDDDGDGLIDWDGGASAGLPPAQQTAPDPTCSTPWWTSESHQVAPRPTSCGLGFELVFAMPLWWGLRARRCAAARHAARPAQAR